MKHAGNVPLPVFEITGKSAAKDLFKGRLGFLQQALDRGVPHSQSDYAARWQRAELLGKSSAVITGIVCIVAFLVQQCRCILVKHSEVDPSAEVFLEGITAGGKPGCGDASGQQRPGNPLCAVQL